eukprot:CAMPEP_0119564256 /NCGR_PEP_ID=MMETSP1352-20130426/26414_1 /TAXON_ID=265584 /ORGANISM="Stauroneis constricta, Strain CCMP1120" /LENGTH=561 /DNA_ID=CAMNT_0007612999 /DNA_START=65 /DNA_END=1750 /DNA_ORIENTATION=-
MKRRQHENELERGHQHDNGGASCFQDWMRTLLADPVILPHQHHHHLDSDPINTAEAKRRKESGNVQNRTIMRTANTDETNGCWSINSLPRRPSGNNLHWNASAGASASANSAQVRTDAPVQAFCSESKLDEMQVEIILIANKPAYDIAQHQCPEFVDNESFRIKFLRADNYDHRQAAKRLVRFLDLKLSLFGKDKLCSEITFSDLSDDAQSTLRSGKMQILPSRDTAGRPVFCDMLDAGSRAYKSIDSMMQASFYFVYSALEDETTQKNGAVCVHYAHNWVADFGSKQRDLSWHMARLSLAMPLKLQAFHFVGKQESIVAKQFINLLQLGLAKGPRHRLKSHFGSHVECQYILMGYGIPISHLPMTETGTIKTGYHKKWVQYRLNKESKLYGNRNGEGVDHHHVTKNDGNQYAFPSCPTNSDADATVSTAATSHGPSTTIVDLPSRYDVLLGRGRGCQNHDGNRYLKEVVAEWYDRYELAMKIEKTTISEHIIQLVGAKGGVFLKRNEDDFWVEASRIEARNKISHAFRKRRETGDKMQSSKTTEDFQFDAVGETAMEVKG